MNYFILRDADSLGEQEKYKMSKLKLLGYLFGLLAVLSACQTSQVPETIDTRASTSWGADIGSKVWLDKNFNGEKEIYEPGLAHVMVKLWTDSNSDGQADAMIASMFTDEEGYYRFNALDPEINYMVEFVAPTNYTFAPKNITGKANSDFDSDANPNGFTDSIDVRKGVYNFRIDAAMYEGLPPNHPIGTTRVGSRVWLDSNSDGIKQANESGFANVNINLWWDKDGDGMADTYIQDTFTDEDGFYIFPSLSENASYLLEVIAPEGYGFSPKNNPQAPGPDWDSDINPATGFSDVLYLVPNTHNYTYDAGLVALGN
ncbi:MAG: hypothetical protein KC422_01880 [Trueperaceae bacterium]|nr:hypothetical protein [Trueperaceae bacterium]